MDGVALTELATNRLRRDALLWNFTVLGEAAAQVADEVKQRFPDLPWRQPARLRNRIVHGYWSIDLDVIHTTAERQLPLFVTDLRAVLAEVVGQQGEDNAPGLSTSKGPAQSE